MKKIASILFAAVVLFAVSACSKEKSAEDILNEVEEAHDKLEALELKVTNKKPVKPFISRNDYEHHKYLILLENDPGTAQYLDGNKFYNAIKGKVGDPDDGVSKVLKELLVIRKDCDRNLLACFKKSDDDFYKDFNVKEKGNTYVLTYQGDKEKQKKLLQMLIDESLKAVEKAGENPAERKMDKVDSMELVATIDKENHRLIKVEHDVKYEEDRGDKKEKIEEETTYDYTAYDKDVKKIEKPEIFE